MVVYCNEQLENTVGFDFPDRPAPPLRIGISECLRGTRVRYDGASAEASWPKEKLKNLFDLVGICPEVAVGMTVPRKAIRLMGSTQSPRAVEIENTQNDKTADLRRFAQSEASFVKQFSGYIFMKNSPSCGVHRVKVFPLDGTAPIRDGQGVFSSELKAQLPNMPMEDSGRLFDDILRENFVTRCFAYAHWNLVLPNLSPKILIEFHSRYKYLLMAHNYSAYKRAGILLSNLSSDFLVKARTYISLLMETLAAPATRRGHTNVMLHLQGYLKQKISQKNRQDLAYLIHQYRRGEQPLQVPITMLKHHFADHPDEYISKQAYLDPHPAFAGLRRSL